MTTILAGRFETIAPAKRAARTLRKSGFAQDDLSIFHINAAGQHDDSVESGVENAGPEAKSVRQISVVGAIAGAVILGALGWLAGNFLPPYGWVVAVLGACVGAYLGSFMGAMAGLSWKANRNRAQRAAGDDSAHVPRKAGIILAMNLRDAARLQQAEGTLRTQGARDIELTEGKWDHGWADFDPGSEPDRIDRNIVLATRDR